MPLSDSLTKKEMLFMTNAFYEPYKDRGLIAGKPFEVYRNLNRRCFSVRQGGKVVAHADGFVVENARAKISEAGRQRVIAERSKNVHAVIIGDRLVLGAIDSEGLGMLDELYYDPYKLDSFINRRTGEKVVECRAVYFADGKAWIIR